MSEGMGWPFGRWAVIDIPPADVRMVEAASKLRPGVPWITNPIGGGSPSSTLVGEATLHENGIRAHIARLTVVEVGLLWAFNLGMSSGTRSVAMLEEGFAPYENVRRLFPIELHVRRYSDSPPRPACWGLQVELMDLRSIILLDEEDPQRLLGALSGIMGLRWDERYRHLPLRGWYENSNPSHVRSGEDRATPYPVFLASGDLFVPEGLRLRRPQATPPPA